MAKIPNPRVEVYRDRRGQWRWRLRARNGHVVAQGEAHADSKDARRAAAAAVKATREVDIYERCVVLDRRGAVARVANFA
jgi:uncharacterized protein YegP (UPF0339 family)